MTGLTSHATKPEISEKILKSKTLSISHIIELACPKVIHDSTLKYFLLIPSHQACLKQ